MQRASARTGCLAEPVGHSIWVRSPHQKFEHLSGRPNANVSILSPGAVDVQQALNLAGTAPHMGAAVGVAPPADRPWRYNFNPAMPRSPRPVRGQWYAAPAAAAAGVASRPAAAQSPTNSSPSHSVDSEMSVDTVDDVLCGLECDLVGVATTVAASDDVEDDACSAGNTLWMT